LGEEDQRQDQYLVDLINLRSSINAFEPSSEDLKDWAGYYQRINDENPTGMNRPLREVKMSRLKGSDRMRITQQIFQQTLRRHKVIPHHLESKEQLNLHNPASIPGTFQITALASAADEDVLDGTEERLAEGLGQNDEYGDFDEAARQRSVTSVGTGAGDSAATTTTATANPSTAEDIDATTSDASASPVASTQSTHTESEPDTQQFQRQHELTQLPSADAPGYMKACVMLGLDPDHPAIKPDIVKNPRVLKPWSVTGVAWLYDWVFDTQGYNARLLGDQCGVGKTVQALSFLHFRAKKAIRKNSDGEKYNP